MKYLHRRQAVDAGVFGSGLLRRTRGYHIDRVFGRVLTVVPALQPFVALPIAALLQLSTPDIARVLATGALPAPTTAE